MAGLTRAAHARLNTALAEQLGRRREQALLDLRGARNAVRRSRIELEHTAEAVSAFLEKRQPTFRGR